MTVDDFFWRFLDKIDAPSGPGFCWPWLGGTQRGYGLTSHRGKKLYAHRVSWFLWNGPSPPGLVLDHVCHSADLTCDGGECHHRRCVNPAHLELVTQGQNASMGRRVALRDRTICPNGHPWSEETVWSYVDSDGYPAKECRLCRREADARSKTKRRAAMLANGWRRSQAGGTDRWYPPGSVIPSTDGVTLGLAMKRAGLS